MPELGAPLTRDVRHARRVGVIVELVAQRARLELQLRQELYVLTQEDTGFSQRRFVADELALELSESAGTAGRWIQDAELLFGAAPVLAALVADGTWSMRQR